MFSQTYSLCLVFAQAFGACRRMSAEEKRLTLTRGSTRKSWGRTTMSDESLRCTLPAKCSICAHVSNAKRSVLRTVIVRMKRAAEIEKILTLGHCAGNGVGLKRNLIALIAQAFQSVLLMTCSNDKRNHNLQLQEWVGVRTFFDRYETQQCTSSLATSISGIKTRYIFRDILYRFNYRL